MCENVWMDSSCRAKLEVTGVWRCSNAITVRIVSGQFDRLVYSDPFWRLGVLLEALSRSASSAQLRPLSLGLKPAKP